jgi:predicted acetyltransferase
MGGKRGVGRKVWAVTEVLRFVDITPDQLDAVIRVRSRSFGPLAASHREQWIADALTFIADGRLFGVVDGDEVVAAARIWDFQQWWAGRQVPMAGVAGVVVAPEYRGRGVGSRLMRGVLERSRDKGFALTALYPATTVIYRQLGYEFGGGRYRFSFPAADLRLLGGKEVEIRRAGADDAARLLELVTEAHSTGRMSGLLGWPVAKVAEWLGDEENFAYLAADGFVVYTWDGSDLRVDELIARSEATARALWATVGSGSSIARTVNAYVAPHDPVHLLLGHEADKAAQLQRWMLRLLDAPAAFENRGWSPAISLEVDLEIDDPQLAANTGRWHLSVSGGSAKLLPSSAGGPVLRLGARGLAALYAGTPLASLRTAGLATGGSPDDDVLLDTAFAGSAPYMLDYF